MPLFRIETNLPKNMIPEDFVIKTVPILSQLLGRPEQYCVVSVIPDLLMSFAGTKEPCAIGSTIALGVFGVEENKRYASVLFDLVEKELGISKSRMYITFRNEAPEDVGYNGTTFHALLG